MGKTQFCGQHYHFAEWGHVQIWCLEKELSSKGLHEGKVEEEVGEEGGRQRR